MLATHLAVQQSGSHRDTLFGETCRQLADDRQADPFIRAMLSYIASGDWRDVIEEGGLPLKDRVAVALRFLPDDELLEWLEELASQVVKSGELDGILVTGLTAPDGAGLELLQRHVNRTGDVQTAALAAALVVPGRVTSFPAERWMATYRRLLDRWKLYTVRAKMDVARGKRIREGRAVAASLIAGPSHSGGGGEAGQPMLVPFAPAQLWIRCQYCNENISADTTALAVGSAGGPGPAGTASAVAKRATTTVGPRRVRASLFALLPVGGSDGWGFRGADDSVPALWQDVAEMLRLPPPARVRRPSEERCVSVVSSVCLR